MDDTKAVQQLKRGEISGLEWLVNQYHWKAIKVAYLITCDLGLAEDVVQDSFLNVYRYIHGFNIERPFGPWFLRIVTNLAVQRTQKQGKQLSLEAESSELNFEELIPLNEGSIEEQVITAESKTRIWAAIQKLSPRQRAAVIQRYFLDMSEKEMAADLGSPPGTVKWLLSQARKALWALLRPEREQL
jgi:RNA polymerase sigma-70 factor, ECF subfamily